MINEDKKTIHVLQFINNLANGGIETFCLNINKNIDRNKYVFHYFMTIGDSDYYKNEVENLGGEVFSYVDKNKLNFFYRIMPKSLRHVKEIIKILKKGRKYSVVHIHNCSSMSSILLAAFICRVPVRIVHSHNSFSPYWNKSKFSDKAKLAYFLNRLNINLFATNKLGCSKEACKTMYGEKSFKDKRTKIILNGIDLNKFNSKRFIKDEVKKKYNIKNKKINFINVGRFDEAKNQMFLLDIISNLYSIRKDVHLTLIGYGVLEKQIKERVKKLNLEKIVTFLPHSSNIAEILSVMDYFLLPSIYEGLGIVLIEAQAMELPCFVSDCVPRESQVGLCNYIPLVMGSMGWAKYIDKYINDNIKRTVDLDKLSKYHIKNTVKDIEKLYNNKNLF